MTPLNKRVATVLAVIAVIAAILFTVAKKPGDESGRAPGDSPSRAVKSATPTGSTRASGGSLVKPRAIAGLPKPVESPHAGSSAEQETWVASRVDELERLAAFDDVESLNAILAELGNSDPEIRAAALVATRSFGSRDAIPWLERLSSATTDSGEKKALDAAIEYLGLPTVTEYLEENPEGGVKIGEENSQ